MRLFYESLMRKIKASSWLFNLLYMFALCTFIYSWPYTIYQNIGRPMQTQTPREIYISSKVHQYVRAVGLNIKPIFRIGEVPSSAGALSGASVIIVSPAMLDQKRFSERDLDFILAHEVGHLARYDAYRFWTTWRRDWAEQRELAADAFAAKLAGCKAMAEAIKNHDHDFLLGYLDHEDPHPHPVDRYSRACGGEKPLSGR